MSVDDFLRCLKKSRLLTDEQQARVRQSVKSSQRKLTPELVSKQLVKQELLTEWQARMLLQKQTGFVLGRYTLLCPIGKGGMGKVFKAWDKKGQREVAIKVLAKKFAKNEKLVARFRREIEMASQLDSPHIVRTIDAGEIGQSHFMVMEYVNGEGLDAIADRVGRMRADHACELARQAALGLQFAHEQGMVHRDIKPANLIVSFENDAPRVRLLDMGLARLETMDNDGMTRTGQVMGTPDFMAPEQGWNTADVDSRADIYSLGCTLFRLVTGSVPFPGDNPLQVLMARCSADAPLASSIVPDIDPRVDAVLRQMTWRDPSQRFQTAGEAAESLAPLAAPPRAEELVGVESQPVPQQPTLVQQETAQNEPSFQEFLREMDSGSEVTLFETGVPLETRAVSTSSTTVAEPKDRTSRSSRRPALLAVSAILIVGLGVGGFALTQGSADDPDKVTKDQAGIGTRPARPVFFAEIPVQRTQPGKLVNFYAAPEVTRGLDGVTYALGPNSPESATLDPNSGEFYWVPPRDQQPGRVAIRLLAKRKEKVEAEREVLIDVRAMPLAARIVEFQDEPVLVGRKWTYQLRLFGQDFADADAEFRLGGHPPEGLELDEATGVLTWTPSESQIGRHPINVELVDPANEQTVYLASCSVVVRPPPRVVSLPSTSVEAGRELIVDLRATGGRRLPPGVTLALSPESEELGADLDPDTARFRWTPPGDRRGQTEFQIQLKRGRVVVGVASFLVNVTAPKPPPTDDSASLPPDAEITAAEEQIRELFKREFGQRSTSAREQLAARLLARSFGDHTSAMRYALLKLGHDVAKDGRAYGVGVEIVQRLSRLFPVDSISLTLQLVEGYRTRGSDGVDKAMVTEAAFEQSLIAARDNRFKAVAELVSVASLVLRTERGNPATETVRRIEETLKTLPTDADRVVELSEAQALARDELVALLEPYQFQMLFREAAAVRFLQNDVGEPNVGNRLWKLSEGHIHFEAPTSELITGFVDPALRVGSCVIRMRVSAESTAGMLLIGAPASGQVSGYQVPLAGRDLLHIKQSNLVQSLAQPSGRLIRDKSGWDFVEVIVSANRIVVLLNGTRVTDAQLPSEPDGTLGVVAVLRSASAPRFVGRDFRVMRTPGE